jgi:hypothetical protein
MTTGTELTVSTDLDARIDHAERSAVVVWRGEPVGFRDVPERIARESSRASRERLLTGWTEALEALNPLYEERLERWTVGGIPNAEGFDPAAFAVEAEKLQVLSETSYHAALRRYLALVDIEHGDATVADLWHVLRGGASSPWFGEREVRRAARAIGRAETDAAGLDGWRAAESVLAAVGDDRTHAGAAAVSRAYGSLAGSPEWLGTELGVAESDLSAVVDFASFARLARIRRAIGVLNYELRLYPPGDEALARAYYAGIVGHMIGAIVPEAAYLHAVSAPWASATLLRDEILAGQLVEGLEARHGASWWREPAASELVDSVGAEARTEDALARLGYDALDWRPLLRQIRTRLIGEMSGYGGPNITTRAGTRKV